MKKVKKRLNFNFDHGTPIITIRKDPKPPKRLKDDWPAKYQGLIHNCDLTLGYNYPWFSVHDSVVKEIDKPVLDSAKPDVLEQSLAQSMEIGARPQPVSDVIEESSVPSSVSEISKAIEYGIGGVIVNSDSVSLNVSTTASDSVFVLGGSDTSTINYQAPSSAFDFSNGSVSDNVDLISDFGLESHLFDLDHSQFSSSSTSLVSSSSNSVKDSSVSVLASSEADPIDSVSIDDDDEIDDDEDTILAEYNDLLEQTNQQLDQLQSENDETIATAQRYVMEAINKCKADFNIVSSFAQDKLDMWEADGSINQHINDLRILTDKVENAKSVYLKKKQKAFLMYTNVKKQCDNRYTELEDQVLKQRQDFLTKLD